MIIKEVQARAIKDSRGEKTIEVSVNGAEPASAPSGKSTGRYETKPYCAQGLNENIRFLNNWKKWLEITCFDDLERVEHVVKEKAKLTDVKEFGANALYAFESAILKALARKQRKELWELINPHANRFPRPVGNAIGGGLHTKGKVKPTFQEFLLVPHEKTFSANVKVMQAIYKEIGKQLKTTKINDEGAWAAPINDEKALALLARFGGTIDIGIDCAASSFYKKRLYDYGTIERTEPAHRAHILQLIKTYGVLYVEDPCHEGDFEGFSAIRKGDRESMVVGDDLTATHSERSQQAIQKHAISAMIIKPNQNGSLLELKKIIELCKQHKIQTVMSHRSGETMDDALADYAFGFQCDFIKCGIATPWRECKLKRMMQVEKKI